MEFRLLGPIEVEEQGSPLPLGSAKQRALLAILLLHVNEVVSRDRLIDELWGERPPASAQHSLEVYVSRLRKTLHANGDELLVTRDGGYLLRLEPEQLDLTRFDRLAEQGRRAAAARDWAGAAERFREALALWRGSAFGELAYQPFAALEAEKLEEQRMAVLEDRFDTELALGRHATLIAELEVLSAEHPLRERLHGQLMLALYRSGRQAEALGAYQKLRQRLRDELGLDPSLPLQRLEQAILRQDPALEPPPSAVAAENGRPLTLEPAPKPRRLSPARWRPAVLAVAVAGLVVAGVAGGIVLFTHGSGRALAAVDANALATVDPEKGRITGEVLLNGTPTRVAVGAGSVWAVSPDRQSVSRIDAATDHLVQTIHVGHGASGIAYGGRAVWVANSLDGTVSHIDSGTNSVVDTIPVGNVPIAVAEGFGSVWVTLAGDRAVVRLDERSGRRLARIPTGDVGRGIATGGEAVWVSDDERGRVSRIDPRTNLVTKRIGVGSGATAVAYVAGVLWVANELDRTVMGVDARRNVVTRDVDLGGTPGDLAFADGGLWVSDESGGRIVRVDPEREKVVDTVQMGNRPHGIAFVGRRLWVSVEPGAVQHRGGVLRVVSTGRTFDSLDPGLGYDGPALNVLGMLYSGLTAFQRVGNADGAKLVPDLAKSLPVPSDDGRTYVFQLRRGIRYSNGQLVRPRDFRRGLERVFSLKRSAGRQFYNKIRGANGCVRRPKRCDLSAGVVADARANTVTFHLVAHDPEFLRKLTLPFASPVPISTPMHESIVPTTGPYYIASYRLRRRLELGRNPYFREWSKAATPDGFPGRISWTLLKARAASYRTEVRAVEQGRSDVAFDGVPRGLLHEARTQFATQVHAHPLWGVTYVYLNTRKPPFNDLRVRQAANYAAQRAAALPASEQSLGAEPACQILPPNFPGFRRYCPYTVHPGPAGLWNGPDLEKARRLVAASGTKGTRVTVWVPDNQLSMGPVAASLMRSLGYPAHIEHVDTDLYFSAKGPTYPGSRVDAGVSSWFADYTAASNFFVDVFSCQAFAHICDRRVNALIRRAQSLQSVDPEAATRLWQQVDRAIVDLAPVVPLITHESLDLVSRRVGNYESIPYPNGVLLDQLWVK